jgi:uncharacterized PurR-regulated membrane protein YhhQ (DUF165 family)
MKWLLVVGYVGSIFMANWFIQNVGTQYTPNGPHVIPVGFGLEAPSGVIWVGVALILRDLVQQFLGTRVAIGSMFAGAIASFFVAPALAVASAAGFLLSESADFVAYTPLMKRGMIVAAVFVSGVVGLVVDTAVFLYLAFGSLQFWQGQILGKLWVTIIGAVVIWFLHRRDPEAIPALAPA